MQFEGRMHTMSVENEFPQGYVIQELPGVNSMMVSLYNRYKLQEISPEEYQAEQFTLVNTTMMALFSQYQGIESNPEATAEVIQEARDNITLVLNEGEPLYRELVPDAPEKAFETLNRNTTVYIGLINHEDPTGEVLRYLQKKPEFARMVGGIPGWLKNK